MKLGPPPEQVIIDPYSEIGGLIRYRAIAYTAYVCGIRWGDTIYIV